MNPVIFVIASAISVSYCFSQNSTAPIGAKNWMLGGSSVSLTDVWSANNNPAASTAISKKQFGLYSEQRFLESNLKLANICAVIPLKHLHIGGTLNYFGYTAFNQQRVGISLSKSLAQSFALGVQLNYLSTFIEQYGQAGNIAVAFSASATPIKNVRMGFVVFNPTQSAYGKYTSEKIPSYGKLGCSYEVSSKVMLHLEADQQLNQALSWRGGVYYKIHDVFHLALGAATHPTYYTFGTSLLMRNLKLDMATSFHEVLGLTPHIGFSIPASQ